MRLTNSIFIFLHFFIPNNVLGQSSYTLIKKKHIPPYNVTNTFSFYQTISSFHSTYFNGVIIVGSDTLNSKIQITKVKYNDSSSIEDYYFVAFPEILKSKAKDGSLLINNCYEVNKNTFQVLFENCILVTFIFKKNKFKIVDIIDLEKKLSSGFSYLYKCGDYYTGFNKIILGKCLVNKIDTPELFLFDKNFKIINSTKIPQFETSFLTFGGTKYLDFCKDKLLICSPTNFSFGVFDFNSLTYNSYDLKNIKNFNLQKIDSTLDHSIKSIFSGALYGDRLGAYLKLRNDSFNFIKKCYFSGKDEIELLISISKKGHHSMQLSKLKINPKLTYKLIDTNIYSINRNKIITKFDYPFDPYQMSFEINNSYIIAYGYDFWNENLIGKKIVDFNDKKYFSDDRNRKFKYYILRRN